MRVIITGGTGLLGSHLSRDLARDGHEVIVLSRNPEEHRAGLPDGVRAVAWDAKTADGWGELADGAGAIVNLAGENLSGGPWTNERKRRLLDSRVNAGRAVVEAVQAASSKPQVVVQVSGVDYYGPRGDEVVTEQARPGENFLGELCQQWEASTAPADALGVRRPVARYGIVLTMEAGALPRLALPFKLFAGGPLGSGRQWYAWIHLLDAIRAFRFLIENETANGQRVSGPINVCSPDPVTNREFARTLGEVMNRPAIFPVPAFAIQLVIGQMSTVVLDGRRVVPERLQAMGFEFRFPELKPALQDLLQKQGAPG